MDDKQFEEFTKKIVKRTLFMMVVKWTLIIGVTQTLKKVFEEAAKVEDEKTESN